jgi:hypothetical protein
MASLGTHTVVTIKPDVCWSIDTMSMWDRDYIDADGPGYFDFGDNNLGSFHFGYIQRDLDYRFTQRDGKSWRCRRGWRRLPPVVAT